MLTSPTGTGRRRAIRAVAAAVVALALLLWWLLPGGGTRPRGKVTFATGVGHGVYAKYGELLEGGISEDFPGLDVRLVSSEGSVDNVQKVAGGRADFAIAAADAVAQYQADEEPGYGDLRALARLYDDYIQLVVPAGSDIHRAQDLAGKRVGVGQDKSGVQLIARRLLQAAELDMNRDLDAVRVPIGTMTEQLQERRLDAFFWSGGLPTAAVTELGNRTRIRFVPLNNLLGPLHKQSESAHYYRSAVMPADAYPALRNAKAVSTIAVANLLITTAGADSDITEAITREVIGQRDEIARRVHAAQLVDQRTAVFTDPLELHEGAQRYYRDEKP
ncbi:hypothetical protein SRB5_55530 [Streptomyces sp. RB5]|uniref:TAXI family TRAP transporter solute-binding subunit n=1 Tax=Streptomyces smaragdinus TaxID=2585196 RepID=A0A7K0CRJ9_9ACTN|nr:TAXI family TRAP transporter solute-binding subunit [Streptomyces smaragdinus]MQY15374.1 hypothetical protein [Streptomyces smaragdinus]